jgi:hypothetical protein
MPQTSPASVTHDFGSFLFGREDGVPVVLHAHDRPAFCLSFIEALVESADPRYRAAGNILLHPRLCTGVARLGG